jgi:uncharacterized protein (DUF427 family)
MKSSRRQTAVERARDYPRPPLIEATDKVIVVEFAKEIVAESSRALRVLERDHAPSYFIPMEDVQMDLLVPSGTRTWCEWKGQAHHFNLVKGAREAEDAAFHYRRPLPEFRELVEHIAFYPDRPDSCLVDGERARAQPGGYYPGWVTDEVEGPFRGLLRLRSW